MTLVFKRDSVARPIHILLVGAGWYGVRAGDGTPLPEKGRWPQLTSITKTASRVVNWWLGMDTAERLLGRQVSSIEMLLSAPPDSPPLSRADGSLLRGLNNEPIDGATYRNVKTAFADWVARSAQAGPNADSLAVLHWIGHGEDGLGTGGGITLFCEDDRPGEAAEARQYISLAVTLDELRRLNFAYRTICFVDACRAKRTTRLEARLLFDTEGDALSTGTGALSYYCLKNAGEVTCAQAECREQYGFKGGTVITEAVVDALDTFAASAALGDRIVYSESLHEAVNARLNWWKEPLGLPKNLNVHCEDPNPKFALVKQVQPRCMVEVNTQEFGSLPPIIGASLQQNGGLKCGHSVAPTTQSTPMWPQGAIYRAEVEAGYWCAVPETGKSTGSTQASAHVTFPAAPPHRRPPQTSMLPRSEAY